MTTESILDLLRKGADQVEGPRPWAVSRRQTESVLPFWVWRSDMMNAGLNRFPRMTARSPGWSPASVHCGSLEAVCGGKRSLRAMNNNG